MGSFIICSHHQILLGRSNQGEWGWQGMRHAWERGETCTGFWWESPKEKKHLDDQDVDGRMGSEWTLGRLIGVWSAFTGLRIGTVGGLLWMRWWTFGFWHPGVQLVSSDVLRLFVIEIWGTNSETIVSLLTLRVPFSKVNYTYGKLQVFLVPWHSEWLYCSIKMTSFLWILQVIGKRFNGYRNSYTFSNQSLSLWTTLELADCHKLYPTLQIHNSWCWDQ
jgi:hypothetical protein